MHRSNTNYAPHDGELLLRADTRILIPKVLRDKVVRLAQHEGHLVVVKTKYRLRSKVCWPGMDKDEENLCIATKSNKHR